MSFNLFFEGLVTKVLLKPTFATYKGSRFSCKQALRELVSVLIPTLYCGSTFMLQCDIGLHLADAIGTIGKPLRAEQMNLIGHCITPDWPAPANVHALQSTRNGGVSAAPYDSFNLASHVGDSPLLVARNRMLLSSLLPSEPVWLKQLHGIEVADVAHAGCLPAADASVSARAGAVCVVMTADCLPILLCNEEGSAVGAAHAGWRSLCDGVIEATVSAMKVPAPTLMAWLGPAISQAKFEVGGEVRAAFLSKHSEAAAAFIPSVSVELGAQDKWMADLYQLARLRLNTLGITRIYGGGLCTYREPERFYSYRRDGATGRMGSFIWLS